VWDPYFNEVLRDLGAPLMPSPPAPANTVCIDKPFWNLSMTAPHATAEPWGAGVPLEADLCDFAGELKEGDADKTSCSMPSQKLKIDILVHLSAWTISGSHLCRTAG
jgi:hypothetical protein